MVRAATGNRLRMYDGGTVLVERDCVRIEVELYHDYKIAGVGVRAEPDEQKYDCVRIAAVRVSVTESEQVAAVAHIVSARRICTRNDAERGDVRAMTTTSFEAKRRLVYANKRARDANAICARQQDVVPLLTDLFRHES